MRMFLFDVEWEKTKALPLQIKMKIFDSKQTICWGVVVEIINNVQMIGVYLKTTATKNAIGIVSKLHPPGHLP